ncbi:MAG: hypothetical protein M1825_002827 [Sarcosagium campestre]|nr:MAG: hypothetical protein M1825_002827 [Sarcosagium campestre]
MATSVDMKLLKQTKFPPEFTKKVDMKKVNLEVMKRWISSKIAAILGTEDDIVTELCINLLESSQFPDIKKLQISLTGFLDKDTGKFCKELWNLCLSAQSNPQGVPKELLEAKKLELIQEKKKPPKRRIGVVTRKAGVRLISQAYAREKEKVVAAEVTADVEAEEAESLTVNQGETLDLRDDDALLKFENPVGSLQDVKSILISQQE